MAPWESDTVSSRSDSDQESTATSGPGNLDAQYSVNIGSKMWKKEFFDKLGNIKSFGDFACTTRYTQHVNPGLEVAGSLVPLPLVERDASTIKSECEQAPFGRGDDTVVDQSVRKTWQLDASLFRCSNPAWSAFLDTVLRDIVQKLGMPKGVQAVPWKLLLYEEGSFFKPHKDSEKAPGMIGTLVISLPSKHEGGEVQLSHSSRRRAFATSNYSEFDLTALAWYSDVTHEIKPITSGFRLVITYNLIQQSGSAPSAGLFIEQQTKLRQLLQNWTSAMPSKTKVIFRLEHKYSQSSLSPQNMKGRDAQIIRCLKQACQETGFYLLLAVMTRTESDPDDYYGDYGEDIILLDYVTSLEGNCVARSVEVEISEILGPDPYKGRRADSEDEGEFTGNESAPSEYRYHDSALLIVPSNGLVDLIKSPQCSAANLVQMVCFTSAVSPDSPTGRLEAIGFLESLLDNFGPTINEPRLLSMILRACKLWASQALYNKTMRRALMEAQRKTSYYLSHRSYMTTPSVSPTAAISEAVSEFINEFFSNPTHQDWNECLGELVQSLETTSLNAALKVVQQRLRNEELKDSFGAWRSSVESTKFEAKDILTAADLDLVLYLVQSHSNDEEWLSTRLLPKLSQRAEKPLLYGLIHKLSAEDAYLALKSTESLARRLFEATLPRLHLDIGDLETKSQRPSRSSTNFGGASNAANNTTSTVTGFENLLEICFMCLPEDRGLELLRKTHENLSEAISHLPPRETERDNTAAGLRHYGVPNVMDRAPAEEFLSSLVVIMHKYQLMDAPSFVKDLFLLLFTRYILPDQPKNPPQRPQTWSHKPRFCYKHNPSRDKIHGTCHECVLIQDFIRAPDQVQGRFTYSKKIREHLQYMLPSQHYRCTTDTTRGQGGCHTLVVTKIGKDTEYKEDMKEFGNRIQLYEQRLLAFRQPIVRRLLGKDAYQSLIMLNSAPNAASAAFVPTKRAAGENQDQPASTRQRTDYVIDLTGE